MNLFSIDMSDIDVAKYKKLYIDTSREQLLNFSNALTQFSQNTSDNYALKQMHLLIHTIATKTLMMGYRTTGILCREVEYICKALLSNSISINPDLLERLKEAPKHIEESLQTIDVSDQERDASELTQKLQTLSGVSLPVGII